MCHRRIFLCLLITLISMICMSQYVFARNANEIEVYKMGDSSITLKWTPYSIGGANVAKYTIGYRVHGDAVYTSIDIDGTNQSSDFNLVNNEFTKKITNLSSGTIYDIKLDTYLQGNPVPITYYSNITTMTQIVIDKTIQTVSNPYGDDSVGHVDFRFVAPNESSGGILSSVSQTDIDGYSLAVSNSQGQIYSSGQPYKVLYNNISGKFEVYRVTGSDDPLTYNNGTQFQFNPQTANGKDLIAFSLYKTNQPSQDNFNLATIYYVVVKPIFKAGSPYENVIVSATQNYETIDTIPTLLPLTVSQIENDLVKLQFPQVGTSSMSYDIYRGRLPNSLSKIHTEYDDGTRTQIQYYNKISDPLEGDVYYFQVCVTGTEVKSKVIPITISLTPNIAPVLNNIQVEKVIADSVNKSTDIIISWDKPAEEDSHKNNLSYRVYLNTDSKNQVSNSDVIYDSNGNIAVDSNGKILLNVNKDINNNNILFNGYPVVYERIAEIKPSILNGADNPYEGDDPIGNFLADGNNYYNIIRDGAQVTRTIYRISGADFLSNSDVPMVLGQPHVIYESNLEGDLGTDYKDKIELNTTYYLKMSTYNTSVNEKSDFSLTTSFTTPQDGVDEVPAPTNFGVDTIETNKMGLVWDELNTSRYKENDIVYEVFMSDNGSYTDSNFKQVLDGTETKVNDTIHYMIDTTYTLAGGTPTSIIPNKVYLFKVRARWTTFDGVGNSVQVYSSFSKIVPVTTKRTNIPDPDVNTPLAPIDFVLTNVSTREASFQWTQVDTTSTYRIVRTSDLIDQFAPLSHTGNGITNGFTQSGLNYSYTDTQLSANTLYYFSIRSETVVGNQTLYSTWVTIPVTTILVEQPTNVSLEEKGCYSITINWKGKANLDYEVGIRTDNSTEYSTSQKITGTLNAFGDKTFEALINGLKSNTLYYIKVRAKDSSTGMYSKYTEAIQVRTEFRQDDYDKEVENLDKENEINDIKNEWINAPINSIGKDENNVALWIKPGKANGMAANSANDAFEINLKDNLVKNSSIYLPVDLIDTLNNKKEIIDIKVPQGDIYIRPGILDSEKLTSKLTDDDIKSKVFVIQISQLSSADVSSFVPSNEFVASKIYDISMLAVGYNKTSKEFDTEISNRIDDLIDAQEKIVPYLSKDNIKESLDKGIQMTIRGVINDAFVSQTYISIDDNKMLRVNLDFSLDKSGKSSSYVAYTRTDYGTNEVQGQSVGNGKIEFETYPIGKFVIVGKTGPRDISGKTSESSIKYLFSHYDFSKELQSGNYRPDAIATVNDATQFIVSILSPLDDRYKNLSYLESAQKLGLFKGSDIWDYNKGITKEQLAFLMAKVYELNTGISSDGMDINDIQLSDQNQINDKYKSSVYLNLRLGIMKNDSYNSFVPGRIVTRGELAIVLVNLINKMESQAN